MATIIGTRPDDDKIYQLSGTPPVWAEFPVQPAFGSLGIGIWGGPNDTIWCHNGKPDYLGGTPKYLFFNGTSWSEYTCPSVSYPPRSIHGSIDGSIVYAGGQGYIHKYSGGVWSVSTTGVNIGTLWCNETGQYIWGTPGPMNGQNIWYSDDYGASWTDVYSQFITDIDAYWSAPFYNVPYASTYSRYLGAIWGISETEVYTTMGYKWTPFLTYTGCAVFKWDGTKWFEVAQRVAGYGFRSYDYGSGAYVRMGLAAGVWKEGDRFVCAGLQGGGVGLEFFRTYEDSNWGETPLYVTGAFSTTDGRCIIGNDGYVVAAYDYSSGNSGVFISDDAFETYTDMTVPWTGINGLQCLTLYGWMVGVPPELQNQAPAPSSTGNSSDTNVYVEVIDPNGDLDASTVDIYINGTLVWTGDSVQPPGCTGLKVPITNGYGYTFSLWEDFDPGSQTVRVVARDTALNELDETYNFTTDPPAGICQNIQWGDFQWGDIQYAQCTGFDITAVAINEYTIRVFFGAVVKQVDPTADDDALNPNNYTLTGGFRQLEVLRASTFNITTVDLTVLEMTDGALYELDILFSPVAPATPEFTGIGVHPRPVSVLNPSAGVLEVYFSEQLLNDSSLGRISSYIIEPQGDAKLLMITGVVVDKNDTSKAVLAFRGGGSTYILSTPGLMDPAGNYCSPPSILFEIGNPEIDELDAVERLFFETDMGPMVLGISELTQRRVEDLAILRAKNEGHLRQFSLIADELDRSGIDRDDRKLKLFKG